jgi:hypothetical protein
MGYVFDPERLQEIARHVTGLPHTELCARLGEELARTWPSHVETRLEWIFNFAAGGTGIMNVFHGSMSEYLIIFGTPIGTEAYSGRYAIEIHDFVLSGEMRTYTEDQPGAASISRPGDHAVLRRGQAKGWRLTDDTWMLEYGRGFVPSSLPCALSDTLIGALDVPTVLKTFRIYGRQTLRELAQMKW